MSAANKVLLDAAARRDAITRHDRSLLVEAGAGSGKTAVMAGRIVMMLLEGVAPKSIAAVTFTELAASELILRVRDFADELRAGSVPAELQVALPHGLSAGQGDRLVGAMATIDEITCSTIHGFCQRLIKPYPVEADIDPGATVMDRDQADLAFGEVTDLWLRENLSADADDLLAELVLLDPQATVGLIRTILAYFRRGRRLVVVASDTLGAHATAFMQAADAFAVFMGTARAHEPETADWAVRFSEMADAIGFILMSEAPADLVRLIQLRPHENVCTDAGKFQSYRKKGKWGEAAKRAGLSKVDGNTLNATADARVTACKETWTALMEGASARILANLVHVVRPVIERFREFKRSAGLLDFDDLIFAARDLLRDHEPVRRALGERFARVLVDEFQDTDPLQTEILWRLCGDPPEGTDATDWQSFRIRAGVLFLVGDPKQAIYRFRGADVVAYVEARDAFITQVPDSVLPISTNFRSCAPILRYVNDRFADLLSVESGQPGFTALEPFHPEREGGLCVAALDVAVADEQGKATADQQRDAEAEAVGEMCARLIGSELILDRKSGQQRVCRPGDIALLAPTGSDLWRYEEALERRGIPVATQAGKGLFQRQEIQDLIALTRILADGRDTLALGALLRGPLVGLTEEELLDIVWALPRSEGAPDEVPRLNLRIESGAVANPYARDMLQRLVALRRQVNSTSPHLLLSQAVDILRVRPILIQRHRGQAERALANVDLFLNFSRAYAVRGLRAFAEAMTAAWADEFRAVEGRPDAQEEAVALYTMHAAKGLEWPIVMPINTMTQIKAPESAILERASGRFYCPVMGVDPTGYEAARDAEKAELDRERLRLWYVAATRARELLVLPRLDVRPRSSAWISLIDLDLSSLAALELGHHPLDAGTRVALPDACQTRYAFALEAAEIVARQKKIVWLAPSRDENPDHLVMDAEVRPILMSSADGMAPTPAEVPFQVQGGRERGLILHKLMEEVLTGETRDASDAVRARAAQLIRELGETAASDPAQGPAADELADCVTRTLSIPEIVELRPKLVPELPVYAWTSIEAIEHVTVGIVDAVAFGDDGMPQTVVDWKSDVAPSPKTLDHYRAQVAAYLTTTGAERGLIVLLTSGVSISVARQV